MAASEPPDYISTANNTHSETRDIRHLQNHDAEARIVYEDHTTQALENETNEPLASKIGPMKVLKSQGRRSTAINTRGRVPKRSEVSQAIRA